jgi:Kef-type K+ transport system membrane component KefB
MVQLLPLLPQSFSNPFSNPFIVPLLPVIKPLATAVADGSSISPMVLVFLQIALVILASRLMGAWFQRLHQPLVIGEIVAGIALGPSLLGAIAPQAQHFLFAPNTLPYLEILAQIGLVFFMFLIGLELDPRYLKGKLHTAVVISHASIICPFGLGWVLALWLYPQVGQPDISFLAFAMFLGAAMSITAFPVLARIISEHNLNRTPLGTLTLTCAAVDDITAWCLLAVAVAVVRTNSIWQALPTIGLATLYAVVMLAFVRPWLQGLSRYYNRVQRVNQWLLAGIYGGVLVSALVTEAIGIHLIFGAFLLGAVMPKNANLTRELALRTEDFVLTFLLPIFFVYSGLRTQIGLLNTPLLWGLCFAVIGVAVAGKFLGSYGAARFCHIPHREAMALGWLMNTRGLTELVILNIGLSLGVITPVLFTMLVIMALVTTFMTSPLISWVYPPEMRIPHPGSGAETATPGNSSSRDRYPILVPLANPHSQQGLMRLAAALTLPSSAGTAPLSPLIYPLSLIELEKDYGYESMPLEITRQIHGRMQTLQQLTDSLGLNDREAIQPLARATTDVAREVRQLVETYPIELVLAGWHRATLGQNRLGGRVGQMLNTVPVDMAVWLDRHGPSQWQRLLLLYSGTTHDDLALELAVRLLAHDPQRTLRVLRVQRPSQSPVEWSHETENLLRQIQAPWRDRLELDLISSYSPLEVITEASTEADLTLAGTSSAWGLERQTLGHYADNLADSCRSSLLITRKYRRHTLHLPQNPLGMAHSSQN